MELMNQFKAQTSSSIGGFLRQLSERKDVDIQKCSFVQELHGMTGVYIIASNHEAMVLAVDVLRNEKSELVDERPFMGDEPHWFSVSNHRVSPIYLVRQIMSLLSICYKKAGQRNVEVGGAYLCSSALADPVKFLTFFEQLNICVLDELSFEDQSHELHEKAQEGTGTQLVLHAMNTSYSLMGLPDLVHSDDYLPAKYDRKNLDREERAKGETPSAGEKKKRQGSTASAEELAFEELDSFERDVLEILSPLEPSVPLKGFPLHEDAGRDDLDSDDEDAEEEEDPIDFESLASGFGPFLSKSSSDEKDGEDEKKTGEDLQDDFKKHLSEVQEALDEQYPSGPSGECNIPSRVQIRPPMENPQEMFYQLVGFEEIRKQIETLTLMSKYTRRRRSLNPLAKEHPITLHATFTGNPGTGKSTVCKLYGALLRDAGVLRFGHVVVVDRSSFIGNCWGDEEKSVRALLQLARGGVLMVDEAYQLLGSGHPTDPGRLVLPLMMNQLADPEWKDVAVVLCGYPKPMNKLLAQNPGLDSRFPNHFDFRDFDLKTLERITLKNVGAYGYTFTREAWAKYRWFLGEAYEHRDHKWANARFVTNWLERIYMWHGVRCERLNTNDPAVLCALTADDVREPEASF